MSISGGKIVKWLAIGFVIVFIWSDPQGNGRVVWDFLGDVGRVIATVATKLAEFLGGLAS